MVIYPPLRQTTNGTPRDLASLLSLCSQKFGENPQIYSRFGIAGHNGLDWPCAEGTHIHSAHAGRVLRTGYDEKGAGNYVIVGNAECQTSYFHFSRVLVVQGTLVDAGDILGASGNTGFSTGAHLHFGLKLCENGTVLNRDNGYDGSVDPTPFLVWPSVLLPMTEKEVRQLQALEGYSDEDGVKYWTGKPLSAYLAARLADKKKNIETLL